MSGTYDAYTQIASVHDLENEFASMLKHFEVHILPISNVASRSDYRPHLRARRRNTTGRLANKQSNACGGCSKAKSTHAFMMRSCSG